MHARYVMTSALVLIMLLFHLDLSKFIRDRWIFCLTLIRFIEKVLAGEFIRERQEVCRRQEWHKVMRVV